METWGEPKRVSRSNRGLACGWTKIWRYRCEKGCWGREICWRKNSSQKWESSIEERECQSSFIFRDAFCPFPSLSLLAPSCLSVCVPLFLPPPFPLFLSQSLSALCSPIHFRFIPFLFPFCLNEILLFVFFWVNSWFCLFKVTCILHLWRANEPKRGHLYCHLSTNPLPFLYMCPFHNIFFIPQKNN